MENMAQPKGTLIIIGGHEEKAADKDRAILTEVSKRARGHGRRLVLMTVATSLPEETSAEYHRVFSELGVQHVDDLGIRTRDDGCNPELVERLGQASVVFFTGGDQLRITSQIGDTPVFSCLHELYRKGATIAGTSAGAAAMPETMIFSGASDSSASISSLGMAPGLGLMERVVIDSHFSERGRFGRLIGAVTQNPKNLGLGIDEDTAIVVEGGVHFRVLGSGAVYVLDGAGVSYSGLSDSRPEGVLSVFGVRMHVLAAGDRFHILERRPEPEGAEEG